jgi:DNA polymerase-3 subunit gamma/tau
LKPEHVQLFYQIALLGRRDLSLAPDEQSGFTMTLLRMLAFAGAANTEKASGDVVPNADRAAEPKKAASSEVNYGVERTNTSAGAPSRPKMRQEPVSTRTLPEAYTNVDAPESGNAIRPIGDWPDFVAGLNLNGLAGMLAKQCEFKAFAGGVLELILPSAQRHLADKAYQDKLKSELLPRLGANLRLNIRVGDVSGVSLAAHEDRERSQQQKAAEAAIDEDPFIKHLKQDFGADVVRSSIRPANS